MAPKWDIDPNEDPYHGDGPISPDKYNLSSTPDLNGSEIGKSLLPKIQDQEPTRLAGQLTRPVPLEHILTFDEGYDALKGVIDDIAQNHHTAWADIARNIDSAVKDLQDALEPNMRNITGETASAMFQKVIQAIPYLTSLAQAVTRMDPLVDSFSRDLKETRDWFQQMQNERQSNVDKVKQVLAATYPPGSGDMLDRDSALTALAISQVNEQYNNDAKRTIQDFYNPPISYISHNHPDMTAAPPQVGAGPGGPGPTLSPGGLGSPRGSGGLTSPAATSGWQAQTAPQQTASPSASPANALSGASDAAKGLTDAAGEAGQQAQGALGQAGDAAKQALDQALQAAGQPGADTLPEGVLGLGPALGGAGATNAGAGSGRGGGGGGGGGGGMGAREPALSKLGTQQASTTTSASATPAARAGVSSTAGGSGAGAPAAGHRGGGGDDKLHQASKALRTNKNGEEVIAEPDAIVPVVGVGQPEPAPTKSS